MTIQQFLTVPVGTERFRIEKGKAFDACPACGQWYQRDARTMTVWRCKCGTQWGGTPCKKCGQGPLAELKKTSDLAAVVDRVCLHCGAKASEVLEETVKGQDTSPVELLKKLGFEEDANFLILKIVALLKEPGLGPSQCNYLLLANKDGSLPSSISDQLSNILSAIYRSGFTQGMLYAGSTPMDIQTVLDRLHTSSRTGTVFTFAGCSWVCTEQSAKDRNGPRMWKAMVGGAEVHTRFGSTDGWDLILKPIFDRMRDNQPGGSVAQANIPGISEPEDTVPPEVTEELEDPIPEDSPTPPPVQSAQNNGSAAGAAQFDFVPPVDEFGICTSLSPDDLVGRV